MSTRQQFIQNSILTTGSILTALRSSFGDSSSQKHILLRSSWQTINIGDIGHTPGVLAILEKYFPQVKVTLWPSSIKNGVEEMLTARFPKLSYIKSDKDLQKAFKECDFLLHGSGASFVAEYNVRKWQKQTGKPFGVYGITFPLKKSWKSHPVPPEKIASAIELLNKADFVYFRDSISLQVAKDKGLHRPVMAFAPDGAFGCDLKNENAAQKFLQENKLEDNKFICCIPRFRYTPSWSIPGKASKFDPIRHARNEEMKEQDHAPLREAIIKIVEETDLKVLICPEDVTQIKIGKDLLYDKLPKHIQEKVVHKNNYWLTDEAISVYTKSAGLFGHELHSAIMCIGHDIPAVICRWKEQTSKGTMWNDIGLNDWVFDMDIPKEVNQITPTLLKIAKEPELAKQKTKLARMKVQALQKMTMQQLDKSI